MIEHSTSTTAHSYSRHRFPAEIIAHAVWLYYRFPLSLRDVEDLLAERGINVSFQTVSVDANGYVLDALLQSRRNKKAALRLMRKLLKSQGVAPRVLVTDKLRSYSAAKAELIPGVEHRSHKGLNNRAENSHLPLRRREKLMTRFKSARQCQRFVSTHGQIANLFHLHRNI